MPSPRRWATDRPRSGSNTSVYAPTSTCQYAGSHALKLRSSYTVVPDDERVAAVFGLLDSLVRRVPIVRLAYDTPADGVALLDELAARWS